MDRYADLTNSVAFRRVFGENPDILAALLDDLLGRGGEARVETISPIAPEHVPDVAGAALPITSVRCRDARRTTFIIEVQILRVPGFLERTMVEACRAYVDQIHDGGDQDLGGVVAVSLCGFELWPDRDQDARRAPRVPMLSRWRMAEQASGAGGDGPIEHVVLEIPKLHGGAPATGVERWAWIFRHAAELDEVPAHLGEGPQRRAIQLAELSRFSAADLDAYRRARVAVDQTREAVLAAEARGRRAGLSAGRHEGVVQGKRDGLIEGEAKGRREALREALLQWIDGRGLDLDDAQRDRIEGETRVEVLTRWVQRAPRAEAVADIVGDPGEGSAAR